MLKVYFGHSTNFDYKTELYQQIRNSDLNSQYDFIFPHENSLEPFSSLEYFKTINIFCAEVSYPSTGLGIELGWANSQNIPIICFHHADSKPSSSLKTITDKIINYTNAQDLLEKLKHILNP